MNPIEHAILRAQEEGRVPGLADLGGERTVLTIPSLALSRAFGDIVGTLASEWIELRHPEKAVAFVSDGLLVFGPGI